MQTVGLITYDYRHLKTEQVLERLVSKDCAFRMYALPFQPRKARPVLISHRPDQSEGAATESLAAKYGLPFERCASDTDIGGSCDVYIILGAGLLSAECVAGKKIINGHPGIIPASRGLDSFKWAIYEGKPLGVTLHYIDAEVDAGDVISVIPTPVYESDTIESLARRHYETEIDAMARFDEFLRSPANPFEGIEPGEARMRMPLDKERELVASFSDYLERFGEPVPQEVE